MFNLTIYEAMAKLKFNGGERAWAEENAEALLKSFGELDMIDAKNAEPLVTVLELTNIFRDDVAVKFMTRDELLSNAPEQYGGYFQVPKTLND